jgi:hypothetical protein
MVWSLRKRIEVTVAAVLLLIAGVTSPRAAFADGAWLDSPQPQNWNAPGQAVPAPPQPVNRAELDARCLRTIRPSESDEDAQVEKQGWLLVSPYTGGWNVRIIQGATGFDGMCRPLGYQYFVFSNGAFAGTLSPLAMDARTDGSLNTVFVNGPESPNGPLAISANFGRYTAEDALCCPSSTSSVSFQVRLEDGQPLVAPTQVSTYPNTRS